MTDGGDDESQPLLPANIDISELGKYYGVRRFHVCLLAVSLVLSGPAVAVTNTAPFLLAEIQDEFGIGDAMASLFASSVLFGSLLGVVLGGRLSDKFGRRVCLAAFSLAIGSCNAMHLFIPRGNGFTGTQKFMMLVVLRLFLGVPYGGILTTIGPYIMEFFPDHVRGSASTLACLSWPLATVFAIRVVQMYQGSLDWRLILTIAPLFPTIIALLGLAWLPESPRWLFVAGKNEEAQSTLNRIFASPPIYGRAFVGLAPEVHIAGSDGCAETEISAREVLSYLFSAKMRPTTLLCCTLYGILVGVSNSLLIWGPRIVQRVTHAIVDLNLFVYSECCAIIGILVVLAVVDVVGRRFLIILGNLIMGLIILVCLTKSAAAHIAVLWCLMWFGQEILRGTVPTYVNEVFPTSVRAFASGFVFMWGRLAAVVFPAMAGALLAADRLSFLFCSLAVLTFCSAVIAWMFLTETAGCELCDTPREKKDSQSV